MLHTNPGFPEKQVKQNQQVMYTHVYIQRERVLSRKWLTPGICEAGGSPDTQVGLGLAVWSLNSLAQPTGNQASGRVSSSLGNPGLYP